MPPDTVGSTTTTAPGGELPEGVEPTDLLTFAQGAVPVAVSTTGTDGGTFSEAVEMVDGVDTTRVVTVVQTPPSRSCSSSRP